jgi:cytoskeletal protein CcmA (bactofilin family)
MQIFIAKGSIIKGVVCYFRNKEIPDFNTQIVLEKGSKIKGQVYCHGSFELKGIVSGCVYTRQFISNTAGSIYVNHILDGIIENENVPTDYGGIVFYNQKKTILQWLY